MATFLDGAGKILMALSGFDWIWGDLAGSGCRFVWNSKFDFVVYGGIQRDYKRIWRDLACFS